MSRFLSYWPKNHKAFSLIQLTIGIAVIAIFATAAIFAFGDNIRLRSLHAAHQSELQAIQSAIDAYYLEHNSYPTLAWQPVLGNPGAIDIKQLAGHYLGRGVTITEVS